MVKNAKEIVVKCKKYVYNIQGGDKNELQGGTVLWENILEQTDFVVKQM